MSDQVQIALVNMPFSYAKYPPIQRGTLSALLKLKRNPRRLPSTKRPIRPPDRRRITREHLREEGALRRVLFPSLLFRYNPKRAEYPRIFKPVFEQIAQESGRPTATSRSWRHALRRNFLPGPSPLSTGGGISSSDLPRRLIKIWRA